MGNWGYNPLITGSWAHFVPFIFSPKKYGWRKQHICKHVHPGKLTSQSKKKKDQWLNDSMYLQILVMYRWAPCMDLPTLRLLGRWWDAKITCLKAPGVSVQRRVWCFYSRGRWNLRVHERWNITTWTRGKFLGKYSHPMEPLGVALYWLFSRDPYDSLHIIITPIVLGSISSPKKNKKNPKQPGARSHWSLEMLPFLRAFWPKL